MRTNDGYAISGRKVWTTMAQRANKMLIIARTTPKDQVRKATEGLSLFYTDFDRSKISATVIPRWAARRWSPTASSSTTWRSRRAT